MNAEDRAQWEADETIPSDFGRAQWRIERIAELERVNEQLRAEVERLRAELRVERGSLGTDGARALRATVDPGHARAVVQLGDALARAAAAEAHAAELQAALTRSRDDHQGAVEELARVRADTMLALAREAYERGDIGKPQGVEAWDWLRGKAAALAGSSQSTAGSDAPCRCGHAKAEHPAPDGDTYCRRCSCAHYLPTVADMMRDEAAVGRLLAAVDGSAGSDGEGTWPGMSGRGRLRRPAAAGEGSPSPTGPQQVRCGWCTNPATGVHTEAGLIVGPACPEHGGPAAQEATRPDGCVTHQAFWPIGAKVCDAISSGGVVGGGPCVAGEHPAQDRTTPPAEATSGGGDRG